MEDLPAPGGPDRKTNFPGNEAGEGAKVQEKVEDMAQKKGQEKV